MIVATEAVNGICSCRVSHRRPHQFAGASEKKMAENPRRLVLIKRAHTDRI